MLLFKKYFVFIYKNKIKYQLYKITLQSIIDCCKLNK